MCPGVWHRARSRTALLRRRARRRALQGPCGREQLVEVRNLPRIVTPCAAHRTAALDQEGRPFGHVLQSAELVSDAEPAHGVGVPVGQELDLAEVERLAPGRLRPGRVARDRVRRDARPLELGSPVTQELELVRSGRRPGEEEEEEKRRAPGDEVGADHRLPRSHPDRRVGDAVSVAQHRRDPTSRRRRATPTHAFRESSFERRSAGAAELLDDVRDRLDLRRRQP